MHDIGTARRYLVASHPIPVRWHPMPLWTVPLMPRTGFFVLGVLVTLVALTALVPTLVASMHEVSATLSSLGVAPR